MLSADNNLPTICALQPATHRLRALVDRRPDEIMGWDEVVLGRSGVEVMACGLDGKQRPRGRRGGIHRMLTIEIHVPRAFCDLLYQISREYWPSRSVSGMCKDTR